VTGASRGIGLAIAQRLVEEGARVCITARKLEALEQAVQQLGGPGHAIAVAGRADDPERQNEAVNRTIESFGSIDVLVNNAGINPIYGPVLDTDFESARKIVEVNCLAAISWVKVVHEAWMGEHGGAVVNMSSVAGIKPTPGIGFYGATKAMLVHITQELAVELGPGIRVNAVAPAVVKTRFATPLFDGKEAELAQTYPLGRLGEPADIASVVAFLASQDAAWLTGQLIVVDGGVTLTGGGA
jgi:3-oxoacyl-[acyl-carrier protein] reductase